MADNIFTFDETTEQEILNSIDTFLNTLHTDYGIIFSKRASAGILMHINKDLALMNGAWAKRSIQEFNRITAVHPHSIQGLAGIADNLLVTGRAATGNVNCVLSNEIISKYNTTTLTIASNAILKHTDTGLTYYCNNAINISMDAVTLNNVVIPIVQGTKKYINVIGSGDNYQSVKIEATDVISMQHINVYVDGVQWTLKHKMLDMLLSEEAFVLRNDFANGLQIIFGGKSNGKAPASNSTIVVEYVECNGSAANISADTVFEIVQGVTINAQEEQASGILTVTAKHDFVSGYDGDTPELGKHSFSWFNSSVINNENSVLNYFRQFIGFVPVKTVANNETRAMNITVAPNIALHKASVPYMSLSDSNFILSTAQIDGILNAIDNDKLYSFGSSISIDSYQLQKFGLAVVIKLDAIDITASKIEQIKTAISNALYDEWTLHAYKIRKTALINAISEHVESVNVQFIGDSMYIDAVGDIDTSIAPVSNKVPAIRPGTYLDIDMTANGIALYKAVGQQIIEI